MNEDKSAAGKVFHYLEPEFTRQDVLKQAKKLDYSYSHASSIIPKLEYQGKIERIRRGVYRKLQTSAYDELEL